MPDRGRRPNFVFIGADKAGSTWLDRMLRAHPQCYVPPAKDVYFFDRYYDRGLAWYTRLFAGAPREARAVGELSHDYLYSVDAAARIARDLPDVKLIVFLRDPASRSFSEYLYLLRSGERFDSFADAVARRPEILEHSRYASHLGPYLERFGPRVGTFLIERLLQDPRELAHDVYRFLGLDPFDGVEFDERVLPASRPRSVLAARAAKTGASAARAAGLANVVGVVKRSRLGGALYRPYDDVERPRLSDAELRFVADELADDLRELAKLVDLPIAREWKTAAAAPESFATAGAGG